MEPIDTTNPIVSSVRKHVDDKFGKDQHGSRALYFANWLSTQTLPTGRQAESTRAVANEILGDICSAVSAMLKGSEEASPEVETLRQIHEIGSYRIMATRTRVGTVIVEAITNDFKKRPFASSYVCTLLPPGRSFEEKVERLSNWFYSKDQEASNYLYHAHQNLIGMDENRPPKRPVLAKHALEGNLRIQVLLDTTNRRLQNE